MRAWHYLAALNLAALTTMLIAAGCNADQSGTPQQAENSPQEVQVEPTEELQVTAVEDTVVQDTVVQDAVVQDTADQDATSSDQQATASDEQSDDSPGLAVGEKAPDFELKDQNGQSRSLSEMLKSGQVAMVYYRSADW